VSVCGSVLYFPQGVGGQLPENCLIMKGARSGGVGGRVREGGGL